jgi:hypothetical protein
MKPWLSILALCATSATASELIYEEVMEHPYSQFWIASYADSLGTGLHHIYLRGEGKRGDFTGVLYLNCAEPRFSRWEAVGGYLTESSVPKEAVNGIRAKFCK